MAKQPSLYSFTTVDALAHALRKYILEAESAALSHHSSFRIAVSGGSLPNTLAKALLAEEASKPQFTKWDIFFADERAVPLDHEDSTYRLLNDELLQKIPESLGTPNVHKIHTQHLDDTQELADTYEKDELVPVFAAKDTVRLPLFDLILLGCGPDGHTCSLFPNHELLRETDGWVLPIEDSPKPPLKRITLSLPVVTAGARIAFVATGGGKKEVLKKIFDTEEGRGLPSGLVNEGAGERVSWFCDDAATETVRYPKRGNL